MNTDLLQAQAFLRTEGISFPSLPNGLAEQLRERRNGVFSTRAQAASPYALEAYVSEWLRSENPATPLEYAVIAMDGHGVNSWAFHYYLVAGPLALFIQLPWGGAYTDKALALAEIERIMTWAQPLPERLNQLQGQGRLDPTQKLVVVLTHFSDARWAWVRLNDVAPEDIAWQPAQQMLAHINEELDTLSTQAA
ncbi:MAG: hypothetical protein WBC18_07340 [Ottowia sp.]|uniref:hypothetical protein n=1 Tax=unclassified Ottowia TaxID=2645081 RepID=UPI003C2CF168